MEFTEILLIDDDEDDREIFLSAIEKLKRVRCNALGSAEDGLKQLIIGNITPQLIFLDLNMPIMSGQVFLKAIKQLDGLKEIPVIIFSTSSNQDNIDEAQQLGAHTYIIKPYSYKALVGILQDLL